MDNLLIIDKFPKRYMEMGKTSSTVKPLSIEEPKSYLGYNVGKVYYYDGLHKWIMVSKNYVDKDINNIRKKY